MAVACAPFSSPVAPGGVHHIVVVAFGANIATDLEPLTVRGSVAASDRRGKSGHAFSPLLFKNISVEFLDEMAGAEKRSV